MVLLRNCGESESHKATEFSEEFPPSPSYSPLYSPLSLPRPSSSNSSVTYVWGGVTLFVPNFYLALLVERKIQDGGGALDVIPSGRLVKINELVQRFDDIVDSEAKNTALEYVDENYSLTKGFRHYFEPLEKQNEDIIDQLVVDSVDVRQRLIQYRDGALYRNTLGGVSRLNGSEISYGQLLTSTPELALIFQTKLSLRLWQGHRGQWVADIWYGWNWLNIGTLKTAEGAPLSSESVLRFRGGKDLFDYPFSELLVNENRAEPTTKPRTEIQMLELSPTEEQENPNEDFEFWCSEAMGNDGVEAEATGNDGFEAVGIRSCNGCDSTAIQVIQSTLLVDQEEIPLSNYDTLLSDQALAAIVDINSVLVKEIPPPLVLPTAQQENLDEDLGNNEVVNLGNDEVDDAGIGGEGTKEGEIAEAQFNSGAFGKRKRKEKTPRGGRGNKKTTPIRNYISLEKILQVKKMRLTDAAEHLEEKQVILEDARLNFPDLLQIYQKTESIFREKNPNKSYDKEGIIQLYTESLQAKLGVASDTNSGVVEEITPLQFSSGARQENPGEDFVNGTEVEPVGIGGEIAEPQLNPVPFENRKGKTPRGERGKKKTTRVRNVIPLENILQVKKMRLKGAAGNLKVSQSALKRACREHGINRWPPRNETPPVVDQEGIPQLSSNTLPSDQVLTTTLNTNSVTEETASRHFLPTVRQDNPYEDYGNEAVGIRGARTGEGEMKKNEKAPGVVRGKYNTTGVRIEIALEEILRYRELHLKDAARELKVGRSTLKRICRDYNIHKWPPREEHVLTGQSHPNESPTVVDQERIPQLNSDMLLLPSNQITATSDKNSVTVKAKYKGLRIKFQLFSPWRKVELEQEVKKRLQLDAATYYINYKDEDDEMTLIGCDEDLEGYISSSCPLGTIELFLEPK